MEPEEGSPYSVPTRTVSAKIEIEGGRREDVIFYLSNAAETHEGPETMAEALNRPRLFLPVRTLNSDVILLVRRSSLVTVEVPKDEGTAGLIDAEGTGFIDFVRLELIGGEVLEGAIVAPLPPDRQRMSDYFNLDEVAFAPLLVGEQVVYVNKERIDVVHL